MRSSITRRRRAALRDVSQWLCVYHGIMAWYLPYTCSVREAQGRSTQCAVASGTRGVVDCFGQIRY